MMYYFLKLILHSVALDEEAADVHKGHNKYEMSEGSPWTDSHRTFNGGFQDIKLKNEPTRSYI